MAAIKHFTLAVTCVDREARSWADFRHLAKESSKLPTTHLSILEISVSGGCWPVLTRLHKDSKGIHVSILKMHSPFQPSTPRAIRMHFLSLLIRVHPWPFRLTHSLIAAMLELWWRYTRPRKGCGAEVHDARVAGHAIARSCCNLGEAQQLHSRPH